MRMSTRIPAAKAIADHLRDWYFGNKNGEFINMGVIVDYDDKIYGIKE